MNGLVGSSAPAPSADACGSVTTSVPTGTFDVLVAVSVTVDGAPASKVRAAGSQDFARSTPVSTGTLRCTVALALSGAEFAAVVVAVLTMSVSPGRASSGTWSVRVRVNVAPGVRPTPAGVSSRNATWTAVAASTTAGWLTGWPASVHDTWCTGPVVVRTAWSS